jgi:hypothetical protein
MAFLGLEIICTKWGLQSPHIPKRTIGDTDLPFFDWQWNFRPNWCKRMVFQNFKKSYPRKSLKRKKKAKNKLTIVNSNKFNSLSFLILPFFGLYANCTISLSF